MENDIRTTDTISNEIVEIDKQIISQIDILDTVQKEKHNHEINLMNLNESIRIAKKLISKLRLQKEMLEREYWTVKNR